MGLHARRRQHLLFQFGQDLRDIRCIGQTDHDVEFLEFNVDRVVVFNEEHFHFILKNVRSREQSRASLRSEMDGQCPTVFER